MTHHNRGPRTVHAQLPATSANLGPGFDALALALHLYDDVAVDASSAPGPPTVEVTGEGAGDVPRDDRHLIIRAIDATLERLGERRPALVLRCTNRIPHGRGLGSSAAAIVAGVLIARDLVDDGRERLGETDALAVAAELEGHPDNVAACLLGGLTVAWMENGHAYAARLNVVAR